MHEYNRGYNNDWNLYDLKKDNAPPRNDLNLIRKDRNIPHNDICAQFVFKYKALFDFYKNMLRGFMQYIKHCSRKSI